MTVEDQIKTTIDKIEAIEKSTRGATFKRQALKPLRSALSALLAKQAKHDKIEGRRSAARLLAALERGEHVHGPDCDHEHEEAAPTS